MDRQWIEQTLNEKLEVHFDYPADREPDVIPEVWIENVGQVVNIIAAQHQAEVERRVKKAEIDAIAMSKKAFDLQVEVTELKAQVAVMAEGARPLRDFVEPIRQLSPQNTTLQERCETFDVALSAAPRVLFHSCGRWHPDERVTVQGMDLDTLYSALTGGRRVELFAVECQRHPEQGQEKA